MIGAFGTGSPQYLGLVQREVIGMGAVVGKIQTMMIMVGMIQMIDAVE